MLDGRNGWTTQIAKTHAGHRRHPTTIVAGSVPGDTAESDQLRLSRLRLNQHSHGVLKSEDVIPQSAGTGGSCC